MRISRWKLISITTAAFAAAIFLCGHNVSAQGRLTYPEISTALNTKLPNQVFQTKDQLIKFVIDQIKSRKIDKPLTADREEDLRQAGATEELLSTIRENSPKPDPEEVVDLGDLGTRASNLVKPEYTQEALQAGINGAVVLKLELDNQGRVTSVTTLSPLSHGLTEKAVAAARQSTFKPATKNGKPARAVGKITFTFKIRLDVDSTVAAANALRDKGDYDGAIANYSRVIDYSKTEAPAFFGRGVCYLLKSKYDDAIRDLESAVKLNPAGTDSYFYLGIASDFKGDIKNAAANYAKAIKLNPEYDKRALTRCLYIDRPGRTQDDFRTLRDSIVEACDSALKVTPEFMSGLIILKRGIVQRLKGDFERAITDFESAQQTNPQLAPTAQTQLTIAYNARGQVRFNKKEYKDALEDVNKAIRLDPRSATTYVNRCVINLYGLKEYDQAISDCSTAIKLEPDRSSMSYNHRGYAYEMKKSVDLAIADYNKALEIDPKNQLAKDNLKRIRH